MISMLVQGFYSKDKKSSEVVPHSQPTASQQTVCKFHLDPKYNIFHWGSTMLGDSMLWTKMAESNHNMDIPSTPSDDEGRFPTSSSREQYITMQTSTSGNKTVFSESAASLVYDHGIVNLANYALSTTEKSLLSKGLSFCPSPGECNLSNAKIAVDKLHRSLRLAHFFNENDALSELSDGEGFSHRNFCRRSTWTPPGNPLPTLASFIIANGTALSNLPSLKSDFYNLSLLERTALKILPPTGRSSSNQLTRA